MKRSNEIEEQVEEIVSRHWNDYENNHDEKTIDEMFKELDSLNLSIYHVKNVLIPVLKNFFGLTTYRTLVDVVSTNKTMKKSRIDPLSIMKPLWLEAFPVNHKETMTKLQEHFSNLVNGFKKGNDPLLNFFLKTVLFMENVYGKELVEPFRNQYEVLYDETFETEKTMEEAIAFVNKYPQEKRFLFMRDLFETYAQDPNDHDAFVVLLYRFLSKSKDMLVTDPLEATVTYLWEMNFTEKVKKKTLYVKYMQYIVSQKTKWIKSI